MLHVQSNGRVHTFYVADFNKRPSLFSVIKLDLTTLHQVGFIIVDGNEADAVFARFGGNKHFHQHPTIPWNYRSHADQQIFYGDIARTILSALI